MTIFSQYINLFHTTLRNLINVGVQVNIRGRKFWKNNKMGPIKSKVWKKPTNTLLIHSIILKNISIFLIWGIIDSNSLIRRYWRLKTFKLINMRCTFIRHLRVRSTIGSFKLIWLFNLLLLSDKAKSRWLKNYVFSWLS